MKKALALALVSTALVVSPSLHAAPALTLVQPASAAPGTPAGWGFTLTNDTPSWLVVTGVTASPELTALGPFTDFAAQLQFVIVPPGGSATQGWDGALFTGAGSLVSALPNASASGTITMTYDLYGADPAGAGFDPIASGQGWGNAVSAAATFGTTPVFLQRFHAE